MGQEYGKKITVEDVLTYAYKFCRKQYPNYDEFKTFFRRDVYNGAKQIGIETRYTVTTATLIIDKSGPLPVVHLPEDLEHLKNVKFIGGSGTVQINGATVRTPDCVIPLYRVNDFPFVDCAMKCDNLTPSLCTDGYSFSSRPGELILTAAGAGFTHLVIAYYRIPLDEIGKPFILELHEEALKNWVLHQVFLADWTNNDNQGSFKKSQNFYDMWENELSKVKQHDRKTSDNEEATIMMNWNNWSFAVEGNYFNS